MTSMSSKGGEDMISGLPDEILVHILSFLPIKDAIKTTLLRRFGNLWRSVPRLTFDTWSSRWDMENDVDDEEDSYCNCYDEKFANLIHHVLIFYDWVKIDELCLRHRFFFEYSKDPDYYTNPDLESEMCIIEEKRFAGVIDSLVSFAIIKRCKVLSLEFIESGDRELQQGYILPTIVYRSIYLTELTLGACDITSCDEVWFESLKLLRFKQVVMSDEAMEKILLGCPSLEELSIVFCYGLRNLCCSNFKLKKLEIEHGKDKLIRLSYPNVVCLNIGGWIEHVVVLNSTVVDASVHFSMMFEYERKSYEGFKLLLQSLDQCKTLKLCRWSVMVLTIWELSNIPCPNFSWKQLVLELHLGNCVQIGLSTLLRHVPLLETLKIHVQSRPDVVFWIDQARWLEEYEVDQDKYWNGKKASLENLKIVVIHGDCIAAEPAVIHMAKFVLRNAVALEKMVISTKKNVNLNDPSHNIFTSGGGGGGGGMKPEKGRLLTDELTCILENLVTSPKASTKAVICYI